MEQGSERPGRYVVGVDLGGTNLKLGVVHEQSGLVVRQEVPSPGQVAAETGVAHVARGSAGVIAASGVAPDRIAAIGIGAPGISDPVLGIVDVAPSLGWKRFPLAARLQAVLGRPAFVENDVNAMALAEARFGVGRSLNHFVLVAMGTGIGAGIIIDRKLYRGADYAAGEAGLLIVTPDWELGWEDDFGCWESLAGSQGLVAAARRRLAGDEAGDRASTGTSGEASALSRLAPEALDAEAICRAAAAGDALAQAVVAEVARHLAHGFVNIATLLNPEAIILAGGVSRAGDLLIGPAVARMRKLISIVPRFVYSELGPDAGIIGAASVALDRLGRDGEPIEA
ncbi:MAG TPA: ROK family protein [Limnochordia bacterium]|nr:ROK family protein [Limnochordia bacterium]